MGSGTSKLDHPKGDMSPKLPPFFHRKLEEIRRFRLGATPSKKQLLDDDSAGTNDPKSVFSGEPEKASTGSSAPSPKVAPEPKQPKGAAAVSSDHQEVNNGGTQDKSTEHDDDDHKEKAKKDHVDEPATPTKAKGKMALEDTDDERDVEDQYGSFSSVEAGSLGCPASPSFRVYYIESLDDDIKEDDCKDDYKGSLSDTDIAWRKSSEELDSKTKTRRRRAMKFRRPVLPKGKPGKKFLSVKSLMYPACGGRMHRPRLVSVKSATL